MLMPAPDFRSVVRYAVFFAIVTFSFLVVSVLHPLQPAIAYATTAVSVVVVAQAITNRVFPQQTVDEVEE